MVIAILEPVSAGILVSLINKYNISGSCGGWIQSYCSAENIREEDEVVEESGGEVPSTNTSISDASVHVHCH
jgi:predicted enzyme related to lactoylglutathione lyase